MSRHSHIVFFVSSQLEKSYFLTITSWEKDHIWSTSHEKKTRRQWKMSNFESLYLSNGSFLEKTVYRDVLLHVVLPSDKVLTKKIFVSQNPFKCDPWLLSNL